MSDAPKIQTLLARHSGENLTLRVGDTIGATDAIGDVSVGDVVPFDGVSYRVTLVSDTVPVDGVPWRTVRVVEAD